MKQPHTTQKETATNTWFIKKRKEKGQVQAVFNIEPKNQSFLILILTKKGASDLLIESYAINNSRQPKIASWKSNANTKEVGFVVIQTL